MGRRRSSRPKNPRKGPGHNEANRQTRESRQQSKMLDSAQETRFRYYMEQILVAEGSMQPEEARPFIQGLWTQGYRNGVPEAKVWLKERVDEGMVDTDSQKKILDLIQKYSRWR